MLNLVLACLFSGLKQKRLENAWMHHSTIVLTYMRSAISENEAIALSPKWSRLGGGHETQPHYI
ncbi:hypothetical protein N39L_59340 [Limnospira platensis NIES-39]|uniref:Transposase n=1 Tax=Limnospira platensis NIES-46 TaxID=1236695 RepID=A0A5M3TFD3_LIMPL|nr:hypothetical protein N39L_59340 [Arthrospira platensis NIES-39]GCE96851.1 hypothetical protein NIES46_49250 [Arthrospira platensis NIES-46]